MEKLDMLFILIVLHIYGILGNSKAMVRSKVTNQTEEKVSKQINDNATLSAGLFESDIILAEAQKQVIDELVSQEKGPNPRIVVKKYLKLVIKWPNQTVYYEPVANDTSWGRIIQDALRHIESKSCIKFKQRRQGTRVKFVNRYFELTCIPHDNNFRCASSLGIVNPGGVQYVYIGDLCTRRGVVVHEILHVLGMLHEHSRPDRDDHVTVHWAKIPNYQKRNFHKYKRTYVDTGGIPYDVSSIMHYGPRAFSINGDYTITPKDSTKLYLMGQREALSKHDIQIINRMYGCTPPTTTPPSGACQDDVAKLICSAFKDRGWCADSTQHARYNYMITYCKLTCGFCKEATTTVCQDTSSGCYYQFLANKCILSTGNPHLQYMKVRCKKTCGFCAGSCIDKVSYCKQLKNQSSCTPGNKFVRDNCPASCGSC